MRFQAVDFPRPRRIFNALIFFDRIFPFWKNIAERNPRTNSSKDCLISGILCAVE